MERLVLSTDETATALKLSRETVTQMLKRGEIPAYKDGNAWKVPVSLLIKAIEARAIEETEARRKK